MSRYRKRNRVATAVQQSVGLLSVFLLGTMPVPAQMVSSDNTVGTVVTGNGPFTVTGGTQSLTTLFHSFTNFSPGANSVLFQLDGSQSVVEAVVSRVTGNSPSLIDAQLSLTGGSNPDLFLINPNGITFGNNASLLLPGSFLASTAESVLFENDIDFSAVTPAPAPLLTISAPVGLRMGSRSGDIHVNNTGHALTQGSIFSPVSRPLNPSSLTVPTGEALALIGNNLTLDGGILVAETGHIELAAVNQGQVALNTASEQFTYNTVEQFGHITLANQSLVDASQSVADTDGGGSITLVGHDIQLADASVVLVQNIGTQPAGDIQVEAAGTLTVTGTNPFGDILTGFKNQNVGSGESGNLEFQVNNLIVNQGAEVEVATYGVADGGDVVINASGTIDIEGFSSDSPDSSSTISTISVGSGNAGDLNVQSRNLNIKGGGNLISFNFFNPFFGGSGDSGDLNINVLEEIEITGDNPITQIPSSLTAVTLSNGNGGNLAISTPQLIIIDGGRIGATTFADGDAGNLTVVATESIQLKGIGTSEFNPSMIIGSANIQDPFIRSLFGLPDLPTGQSGRILIQTPNLNLTGGAQINVRNDGTGDSGDLTIEGDFVALDQGSSLTASTFSGEGGNIRLNLDSALVLRNGSQLSNEAGGRGNGGNISINAPVILGIENSDITANAVAGNGGNISLVTQGIIGLVFRDALTAESDITASSQFGVSGTVNISNFNNDITASLAELPSNLEDPSNQIARGCSTGYNELLITGRGGVPRQARGGLLPFSTWHDLREAPLELATVEDQLTSNQLTPPTDIELQEATYWQIATNGDLELLTNNQLSERLLANCTTQS